MRFLLPIVMWSACEAPPCLDAGCDEDADGVALPTDCDDGDPSVGAAATWHPDCDEDGVAADTSVVACAAPAPSEACEDGGVWRGTDEPHDDCDDTDPDAVAVTDWAADCDADGETGTGLTSCGAPDDDAVLALCGVAADVAPGAVGGDCDDADPDAIATATWYVDCDVDGAASEVSVPSCGEPAPTCEGGVWTDDAPVAFDCDDRNAKTQYLRWRLDCDGDGAFGPAEVFCSPTEIICPDTGLSPPRLDPDDPSDVDCDDGDADALPGAVDHMGDGRDLDCDGDDAPRPAGERYYVSRTRGAAGNPGTRAAPFLTLDEALAVCVGGDVVRVAQGRYEVAEASRVRCSIYGGFSDDGAWTFDPARLTDIGIPANTSHSPLNLVSDGHPIELVALTVDVPSNWAMRMDNPPGVVTEFYGSHLTFGGGGWWDTVGTLVDSRLLRSVSVLGPDSDLTFERVVLGAVGPRGSGPAVTLVNGARLTAVDSEVLGADIGFFVDVGELELLRTTINAHTSGVLAPRSGNRARIVDSHLTAGEGLVVTGADVEVVRSVLTGTNPATQDASVGARLHSGTLRVVSSVLRGGLGGTENESHGLTVVGGAATLIGTLVEGGVADTSMGAYVGGGSVTAVNSVFTGGTGATARPALRVLPFTAQPTITLRAVQLDGDAYVHTSGGPSGTQVLTTSTPVSSCTWYGCTAATDLVFGAPVYTASDDTWRLATGSPGRDAGVDPSAYVDDADADLDLHGGARPVGAWDLGPTEQ
jgi:hypothetical protein